MDTKLGKRNQPGTHDFDILFSRYTSSLDASMFAIVYHHFVDVAVSSPSHHATHTQSIVQFGAIRA